MNKMYNTLAENIRYLRKRNNISQVLLAEELGVARNCVGWWENEQIRPSLDSVVLLGQYFMVPIDDLLFIKLSEREE